MPTPAATAISQNEADIADNFFNQAKALEDKRQYREAIYAELLKLEELKQRHSY